MKKFIYFIGYFPPPFHGMSIINENMFILLKKYQYIKKINNASLSKMGKLIKIFINIFKFSISKNNSITYISLSGGISQIFDITFLIISRLKSNKIYCHHHSYSYITKSKFLMRLLILIGGAESIHILLSKSMANKFSFLYLHKKTIFISNSAFIDQIDFNEFNKNNTLLRIGYLGNITIEKGILRFIDVAKFFNRNINNCEFYIAGPFFNSTLENIVLSEVQCINNMKYIGPVYGEEKIKFFSSIDLLLFPSLYNHEADPVTIYEALSLGKPVLSYNVGCISDLIILNKDFLFPPDSNFSENACKIIDSFINSNNLYSIASNNAFSDFKSSKTISQNNLKILINDIKNS